MADDQTSGQETELKFRGADANAFAALVTAAGRTPLEAVMQVNHFFDTPDFRLNSAKYTVRLREEEGAFVLGSKSPEIRSHDGTLTRKSEEEVVVDHNEAAQILSGTISPLDVLERLASARATPLMKAIRQIVGETKLVHVGSFQNERSRLPVALSTNAGPFTAQFEMDRTIFPGRRIDYEVEVELKGVDADEATAAVNAFLAKAQVGHQSGPSKAKRFFEIVTAK